MSKLHRVIEGFRHQVAVVVPTEIDNDDLATFDEVRANGELRPAVVAPADAHATRDRAVLELMVLAMFADGVSGQRERELIAEFSQSRYWPSDTNFELEVDEAVARVRNAVGDPVDKSALMEGIFERLTTIEDQLLALDHLDEMAESDGRADASEKALIALLRDRLR